ncbi:hypothetical protein ACFX2U_12225, partial [Gilliamella apicola]
TMIFVSYDFCLYHRGDFCPLFWRGSKYVSYNNLEVKGTPKVTGTITIELFGDTYGTNTCPGKRYDRVYTIKVEE